MKVKDNSIKFNDLSTQILFAIMVANEVYRENDVELVITSLNDAKHSNTSLHYDGKAVDLRIWRLPDPQAVANEIQNKLTPDFDVLFEGDHIHIEYQPKR